MSGEKEENFHRDIVTESMRGKLIQPGIEARDRIQAATIKTSRDISLIGTPVAGSAPITRTTPFVHQGDDDHRREQWVPFSLKMPDERQSTDEAVAFSKNPRRGDILILARYSVARESKGNDKVASTRNASTFWLAVYHLHYTHYKRSCFLAHRLSGLKRSSYPFRAILTWNRKRKR